MIGSHAQIPAEAPEPANLVGPGQSDHVAQVADDAGLAAVAREGDLVGFLQRQLVIDPLPRKRERLVPGMDTGR
jgi:hypothetical protein